MCVCVKCPLTCLWSWMFFSLEMWEFWFFFRRSSIWSLMLFTCGTKQKGSHEDLGEAHSVDSPPPLKYTLVLYHCLTSDGGRRGGHRCMETASPPRGAHARSPGCASCRLRPPPCAGSRCSRAAAALAPAPAASARPPPSACCSSRRTQHGKREGKISRRKSLTGLLARSSPPCPALEPACPGGWWRFCKGGAAGTGLVISTQRPTHAPRSPLHSQT